MPKLLSIGELLIDFIPHQKSKKLKDVDSFERVAGGAPANVCACVAKLGLKSLMMTQVGHDAFGEYLVEKLGETGVDVSFIKKTDAANTALAFVSLDQHGERDFSFYRNPSADMLYHEQNLDEISFDEGDILHFCSVDLIESPMKKAHQKAIQKAHEKNMIVSFDPNLRFPLWKDHNLYKETINEFIPQAHILKISHDELDFITGEKNREKSITSLFRGHVKVVIITEGSVGATIYTKQGSMFVPSIKTEVVDTTGAGDSFIGAILYKLLLKKTTYNSLDVDIDHDVISFAHKVSSYVIARYGAIPSLPTLKDLQF